MVDSGDCCRHLACARPVLSQLPNVFCTLYRYDGYLNRIGDDKVAPVDHHSPTSDVWGKRWIELCAAAAILKDHPIRFRFHGSKAPLRLLIILLFLSNSLISADAEPRHGIAMHGEPALPPGFTHLPYANPRAPKGGVLKIAITGSFDSTNPFIVMGQPVYGVRTYTFESLLGRNADEAFSLYGLLAESINVSPDFSSATFKLRPEARFSDGKPVTAADVAFSLELLRDHGRPNFANSYSKVSKIVMPDAHTVTFEQTAGDRELPMILGLMPVLPKHFWKSKDFEKTTLKPLIGSGPYRMKDVRPGEGISYRLNSDYWGRALPINRGQWNFDEVRIDYYRDNNATFEAFKKGLADFRIETDPTRWSTGYDFPAVTSGDVILEKHVQRAPAPASGFAMNTRRPLFADKRVRDAMIHAFDFEWANRNLFHGLLRRTHGYYSGSELSSAGIPASQRELSLLGEATREIDAAIINGTYRQPVSDGTGHDRRSLRRALELLLEAGFELRGTRLVNTETGARFRFTLSVLSREQEKIALHFQRSLRQIGIAMTVRTVDSAQFQRMLQTYDYDMVPISWYNSLSPGNEQVFYYGSAGRTVEGTRNYPGIADPHVDRMIEELLKARTREDFVTAVRSLDRLLVNGRYIVPLYDAGGQWLARWKHIGRPDHQPVHGFEPATAWREKIG
jgi:peptide/nickel transport system substrate-binding protein